MSTRHLWTVLAAGLFASTAAFAQHQETSTEAQTETTTEVEVATAATATTTSTTGDHFMENTPVTLVGCLQLESDYRREHERGHGGAGMGNEFILINAVRMIAAPRTPVADVDCSVARGESFELTGDVEDDLETLVGQRIEISGYIKKADTEVGTSGELRPSGGYLFAGGDLKLWEVNVDAFREPTIARVREERPMTFIQPAPLPSEPVGTSGYLPPAPVMAELPRTASPLPLAGLATFLLLGGAFSVRSLRRNL